MHTWKNELIWCSSISREFHNWKNELIIRFNMNYFIILYWWKSRQDIWPVKTTASKIASQFGIYELALPLGMVDSDTIKKTTESSFALFSEIHLGTLKPVINTSSIKIQHATI